MADNVTANAGSGGATLATDDISGVHYPRTKITIGADGVNGGDVSSANPLPISDASGSLTVDDGGSTISVDDGAGSLTVDGTVAATQSGTWNIAAVTSVTNPVAVTDNSGSLTVDNAALSVTGGGVESSALRVTLASDSTGLVSVDDNGGSLTIDNAALSVTGGGVEASALRVTIATDSTGVLSVDDNGSTLSIDDGAGSITVDGTVAATQSGTWNIGTVTSITNAVAVTDNSGSLTVDNAGTFAVQATVAAGATNIAKAEDVASADADVGVPAMAVRKATPANTSGTDGDYEFLQMSAGRLWVDASGVTLTVGSHAVTNAGTFVVQENGAALTSLQLIDDVIVADDAAFTPATTKVAMAGFTFDDVSPDTVNEGDAGAARMSANRCIYVNLRDNAGNERGLNIDSSGNLTANITGTVTVGSHAVTNAGTFAVQESGAALTALQLIDNIVLAEDAAHSSGDPGVMMFGVRRDANTSLVDTTGDYAPLQVDSTGNLKVAIISGAGSGGTSIADDAAFTVGTTSVNPVGGIYRSVLDNVDDGDAGAFAMTANRIQMVNLRDASGTELSVGGGTQYNEDDAHASGNKVTMAGVVRADTAASTSGTDGDISCLITDSTGRLWCNVSNTVTVASHAVTNAGTFAVQATVAAGATNIAKAEDVASADADVGVPAMAVRKATPANTSGTDGDYEMLQMSAGRLWVDASGVTLTVASHAVTNAGTFVVQENGSALTSLQLIDDTVFTDDAAFTPATSKVLAIGLQADETSTDSVDEGDIGCPRMTLDRKAIVTVLPHTAGGLSVYHLVAAGSTNATNVKASAGQLYGWYIYNAATSMRKLVFHNNSGTPTAGASVLFSVPLPASAAANVEFTNGIPFSSGIAITTVTGIADSDTAAVTANDLVINLFYK